MTTRAKISTKITRRSGYGRKPVDTDGVTTRDVKKPPPDPTLKSSVEVGPSSRRIVKRGALLK